MRGKQETVKKLKKAQQLAIVAFHENPTAENKVGNLVASIICICRRRHRLQSLETLTQEQTVVGKNPPVAVVRPVSGHLGTQSLTVVLHCNGSAGSEVLGIPTPAKAHKVASARSTQPRAPHIDTWRGHHTKGQAFTVV